MKKIIYLFVIIFSCSGFINAQSTIWLEGFENTQPNNLPPGWSFADNSGFNFQPDTMWTVRDSGAIVPGVQATRPARSYEGLRSASVSWLVGTGGTDNIGDAWMVTKKIVNVPNDGIFQFFATGGTPTLSDSMQIWISTTDSTPASFLANPSNYNQTIKFAPNPIYAQFSEYFIDLFPYAGQSIYVGFRYYIDVTVDGVMIQVDNVSLFGTVGISQSGTNIPEKFSLAQNYPNPFNPSTKINFDLAKSTNVKLTVFNSLGQKVADIFEGFKPAGSYKADFNGSSLSSGIYFYRLETDFFTETKKMQLVK
ncbi:MAG: choice-of-anchor J domain-containing protein [bacterium]|nr:choice-of-anchor J domain-containing protein [bacterium]